MVTRGREAGYFVLNHDCAIVLLGAGVDRVPVLVLQLDAEPRDARAGHVVRIFDGVDWMTPPGSVLTGKRHSVLEPPRPLTCTPAARPSHFTIQKYKDFFDCATPTPGYPESPEFVRPQSFRHSNAQGLFEPAQRDATWHPIMENYCPTVTVA